MARILIVALVLASSVLLGSGTTKNLSAYRDSAVEFPTEAPTATPVGCVPCKKPDTNEQNSPANVVEITLDKTEITLPCGSAEVPPPTPSNAREMYVEVSTKAEDKDNDVLTYNYTISGGRIIGQGAKVFWNLSNVRPGTYSITAGADDGCGICGTTMTKTVPVKECSSAGS